ncbi:hypothetical protein RHGRI_026684 [Rhododendron griersonianum]|uniref:Uncharacterized protein n=1 Tax=Rhododendron griersonianum TaxID=479676 RepID=A0AAV6IUS9_9ERIC|nr:hypothetical protein RHGRI_026684 [Rhododendron griersonianum]
MDCSSLQQLIVEDIRACLSSGRGLPASIHNLSIAASWRVHRKIFPLNVFGW